MNRWRRAMIQQERVQGQNKNKICVKFLLFKKRSPTFSTDQKIK